MKLYLSSYEAGDKPEELEKLMPHGNRKIAYVANAFDFTGVNPERRKVHMESDMGMLRELGLSVEELDLKNYFGKGEELRAKLDTFGGVWVSGGNTFVISQAVEFCITNNISYKTLRDGEVMVVS